MISIKFLYLEGLQPIVSIHLKFEKLQLMNFKQGILEKRPNSDLT